MNGKYLDRVDPLSLYLYIGPVLNMNTFGLSESAYAECLPDPISIVRSHNHILVKDGDSR